jgi:hypothetical protein
MHRFEPALASRQTADQSIRNMRSSPSCCGWPPETGNHYKKNAFSGPIKFSNPRFRCAEHCARRTSSDGSGDVQRYPDQEIRRGAIRPPVSSGGAAAAHDASGDLEVSSAGRTVAGAPPLCVPTDPYSPRRGITGARLQVAVVDSNAGGPLRPPQMQLLGGNTITKPDLTATESVPGVHTRKRDGRRTEIRLGTSIAPRIANEVRVVSDTISILHRSTIPGHPPQAGIVALKLDRSVRRHSLCLQTVGLQGIAPAEESRQQPPRMTQAVRATTRSGSSLQRIGPTRPVTVCACQYGRLPGATPRFCYRGELFRSAPRRAWVRELQLRVGFQFPN